MTQLIKTTPYYTAFNQNQYAQARAQNVSPEWFHIYYLSERYFPTKCTSCGAFDPQPCLSSCKNPCKTSERIHVRSLHIADNSCRVVSAVNHYLRGNCKSTRWDWFSTYSNGNANYRATGEVNETEDLNKKYEGGYTSRPRFHDGRWMKGVDGKGRSSASNIRAFMNQFKADNLGDLRLFVSTDGNTKWDIICALACLGRNGTAFIRLDTLTAEDMRIINIARELFAETHFVRFIGDIVYVVFRNYISPLSKNKKYELIDEPAVSNEPFILNEIINDVPITPDMINPPIIDRRVLL